ncbi:MAG: aminoglycoside 6-adenylyltransferase [Phenylobacterium sp.]|uniref:aminoglycoside 6-adenylyltransferase n=1 Tax=Phenylobacterium sp. TaxID=1871053 RepID=UPI00391923E3
MPSQADLIARVTRHAEEDARVRALLLSGSFGKDEADDWSDVDLIAVVSPEDHKAFAAGARDWLGAVADIVHWHSPHPPLPLFGAVTAGYDRLDLTVTVPGMVLGAQSTLKPLLDRDGVYAALPASPPPGRVDPAKVEAIVREFLRVMGLLPLVAGRRQPAIAVGGVGHLRQAVLALLIEAQALPAPVGALSVAKVLPAEDMELLAALPTPASDTEAVIEAQLEHARLFLPRARRIAADCGAAWPEAFEAAVRAHLKRTMGRDWGEA